MFPVCSLSCLLSAGSPFCLSECLFTYVPSFLPSVPTCLSFYLLPCLLTCLPLFNFFFFLCVCSLFFHSLYLFSFPHSPVSPYPSSLTLTIPNTILHPSSLHANSYVLLTFHRPPSFPLFFYLLVECSCFCIIFSTSFSSILCPLLYLLTPSPTHTSTYPYT